MSDLNETLKRTAVTMGATRGLGSKTQKQGKTMRGVAQFVSEKLSTQESVLSTATHFILKKYKDHGSVMVNPSKDERMLVTP